MFSNFFIHSLYYLLHLCHLNVIKNIQYVSDLKYINYYTYKLGFKTIVGCAMQVSVRNGNEERMVIQWKGHQIKMRIKSVVEDEKEKWDSEWWINDGKNMIYTARKAKRQTRKESTYQRHRSRTSDYSTARIGAVSLQRAVFDDGSIIIWGFPVATAREVSSICHMTSMASQRSSSKIPSAHTFCQNPCRLMAYFARVWRVNVDARSEAKGTRRRSRLTINAGGGGPGRNVRSMGSTCFV